MNKTNGVDNAKKRAALVAKRVIRDCYDGWDRSADCEPIPKPSEDLVLKVSFHIVELDRKLEEMRGATCNTGAILDLCLCLTSRLEECYAHVLTVVPRSEANSDSVHSIVLKWLGFAEEVRRGESGPQSNHRTQNTVSSADAKSLSTSNTGGTND